MTEWKTIGVQGSWHVDVPSDAEWGLEEDGTHFVVRLNTKPATSWRMSRHGQRPGSEPRAYLDECVRDFFARCIPDAPAGGLPASVEPCVTVPHAVQGVATDGDGTWWVVRAYGVGSDFFWLQWNGPEEPLKDTVLRIFESFKAV